MEAVKFDDLLVAFVQVRNAVGRKTESESRGVSQGSVEKHLGREREGERERESPGVSQDGVSEKHRTKRAIRCPIEFNKDRPSSSDGQNVVRSVLKN